MTTAALDHLRAVLATIPRSSFASPEVQEVRAAAQRYLDEATEAMHSPPQLAVVDDEVQP